MHFTHNEGKHVAAESILKNKIYKYMNSCIFDIVNKYNNTYHIEIKMKPVDVKSSLYINSSKDINDEDPKFKIGNVLKKSRYKNILAKSNGFQIGLKKFSWLKSLKTLCCRRMLFVILKVKKLLERFTEKNFKKEIAKSLELKN